MFKPKNDEQIRIECGLRRAVEPDEDGDMYWVGSDFAWDCYIDKLNELDPEVNNDNEINDENETA
jgi:hypothetical protein